MASLGQPAGTALVRSSLGQPAETALAAQSAKGTTDAGATRTHKDCDPLPGCQTKDEVTKLLNGVIEVRYHNSHLLDPEGTCPHSPLSQADLGGLT